MKIAIRTLPSWLWLALLAVLPAGVHAATWYVDPLAQGAQDGKSWATAWTNLPNTFGNVHMAIAPGDTVYLSGGTSNQVYPQVYWIPPGGNAANRVTYLSGQDPGHNGTVIFDGQNSMPYCMGLGITYATISGNYSGRTNWVITNYTSLSCDSDNSISLTLDHIYLGNAIRFWPATDIVIQFCMISAIPNMDYAISWCGLSGSNPNPSFPYTNCAIHNCTIQGSRQNDSSGFGSDLMQFGGSGWSVYSNRFTTYFIPSFTEGQHQDGMQGVANNVQIYDNTFENLANSDIFINPIAQTPTVISNIFVYNNIFQVNAPMANDSGYVVGMAISCQGGAAGTVYFTNIVIANNTFVDMFGRSSLAMGLNGTQANFYVANNLTYNCGSALNGPIAIGSQYLSWTSAGISILCNELEAGSLGLSASIPLQSLLPGGSAPVKFVRYSMISPSNDLHLDATDKAARGQGTNLSAQFPFLAFDRDGNARPATKPWDIGAYQTPGLPPPTGLRIGP